MRRIETISLEQMHSTRQHSRWISIKERFERIDFFSFFAALTDSGANACARYEIFRAFSILTPAVRNRCRRLPVGYQSRRAEYEIFVREELTLY